MTDGIQRLCADCSTWSSLTCRGLLASKGTPVVKGRRSKRNSVERLGQGLFNMAETPDVKNTSARQQTVVSQLVLTQCSVRQACSLQHHECLPPVIEHPLQLNLSVVFST